MSNFIEKPRFQCTLGGALTTINSLNRAAAIVHAAPGCAVAGSSAAKGGSGYWGVGYCDSMATPSTNIVEKDVIFGGEDRLAEQIESTLSIIDADLFAVITGCMTDIIGDDVKAVVGRYQNEGKPVVVAETGGFKGNSSKGYDLILEALINQYVEKGLTKDPKQVNLFGLVPAQDVFWRGNLIELKRLLTKLGLKVNTFFAPFEDLSTLKKSSQAILNIVLSDVHGLGAARAYEEIHGIPFINSPLPIGPTATGQFLTEVAKQFGIDSKRLNEVLREETEYYYEFVQRIADLYIDTDFQRFAVVIGDANYSLALTKFVTDDFGWIPYFVAITDTIEEEDQDKILARFDTIEPELKPQIIFETDTSKISAKLKEKLEREGDDYNSPISPAFLLGSVLDRQLATELKAGFLSVSHPVTNRVVTDQAYAGYRGGVRLINDILNVLISNR